MKKIKVSTISEAFQSAVDLIESWALADPALCWFRGVKDNKLALQPGSCWRKNYNEYEPLVSFSQEGVAFEEVGSMDEWGFYYFAQHHGVPTRLLDWSESFSAALFFAFDGWDGRTTPCIWVFQPAAFNEQMIGWDGIIAPENFPETKVWLPKNVAQSNHIIEAKDGYSYDNRRPLAIYPKKSNKRITAQQGAFTVHGRESEPLDALYKKHGGAIETTFARIELQGFEKDKVLHDLGLLGIRRSAIYPDINNFVQQLKEYYKW